MVNSDNSKLSGLDNHDILHLLIHIIEKKALQWEQDQPQQEENKSRKRKSTEVVNENREEGCEKSDVNEEGEEEEEYFPEPCPSNSPQRNQISKKKPRVVYELEVRSEPREATPEWLLNYMRSVNGSDPKKIIDKKLFKTDVSTTHCRLSIPTRQVVEKDFLTKEELGIIEGPVIKTKEHGIKVDIVDEDGKKWRVELRKWEMNKSATYVLVDGWTKLFLAKGYEPGDRISLWSFRCDGLLQLALVPPHLPTGHSGQSISPPEDAGQSSSPPADAGQSSSPPSDAGQSRSPPSDPGQSSSPPADAGQSISLPSYPGQSSSPPGEAGPSSSPRGEAGQSSSPPSDAGQAVSPPGDAQQASSPPASKRYRTVRFFSRRYEGKRSFRSGD